MMARFLAILIAIAASAGSLGPSWAQAVPPAGAPGAAPEPDRRVPETLMFTIDEVNDIRSRMASVGQDASNETRQEVIEDATLYLSTIVYYGPQDWTFWLNGKAISPGQDFQSFKITDISSRFVELLVPLSAQGMRPVRLEPNQTFIVKSGTVVEGPWQ